MVLLGLDSPKVRRLEWHRTLTWGRGLIPMMLFASSCTMDIRQFVTFSNPESAQNETPVTLLITSAISHYDVEPHLGSKFILGPAFASGFEEEAKRRFKNVRIVYERSPAIGGLTIEPTGRFLHYSFTADGCLGLLNSTEVQVTTFVKVHNEGREILEHKSVSPSLHTNILPYTPAAYNSREAIGRAIGTAIEGNFSAILRLPVLRPAIE